MANLPSGDDFNTEGISYSSATHPDKPGKWASQSEIVQFLNGVLLSYRLLFGQSKSSRRLFKSLAVFNGDSTDLHDTLLPQLCSSNNSPLLTPNKEFYRLRRDFPILRSHFATLQYQMSNLKPRGWEELWRDKRDSAQCSHFGPRS